MSDIHRILVTGGAGFVGSHLALSLRRDFKETEIVAFDNLSRRGSELNLPRFQRADVEFIHGDTRSESDLEKVGPFDLLIDCAAEPSVQAGLNGSPKAVFDNNLIGTIHCLEAARKNDAAFLFLSTSRVYPIASLNQIPFKKSETRFQWDDDIKVTGASSRGISEEFSLTGARSYYGASKLASELIAQEYAASANMRVLINRCGVLTGPWQMGKVDQGVVALWVLKHHFEQSLKYIGYGGTGRQVRDILHIEDLYQLLKSQMNEFSAWDGRVYNVGGGLKVSVSLYELTELCQQVTGKSILISPVPETSSVDLRIFTTDASRVMQDFNWAPERSPQEIVSDIHQWICENEQDLEALVNS